MSRQKSIVMRILTEFKGRGKKATTNLVDKFDQMGGSITKRKVDCCYRK